MPPNAFRRPPDGCDAFPAGYFTGTVVLIRRGTCTFYVKAQNAQVAGAVAVVLYNNVRRAAIAPLVTAVDPQIDDSGRRNL